MITIYKKEREKISGTNGILLVQLRGLSTDDKPTILNDNDKIENGSEFIEIDTGSKYLFDASNQEWKLASGGGGSTPATLIEKNISANGTYNASSDIADGYSKVVVSVSPNLQNKSITIEENSSIIIQKDSNYDGLGTVSVTVDVPTPTPTGGFKLYCPSDMQSYDIETIFYNISTILNYSEVQEEMAIRYQDTVDAMPFPAILDTHDLEDFENFASGLSDNYQGYPFVISANDIDTSSATSLRNMLNGCPVLNIPIFDTTNVTHMEGAFKNIELGIGNVSEDQDIENIENIMTMCINSAVTDDKYLSSVLNYDEYVQYYFDEDYIDPTLLQQFYASGWALTD